jgi:hypothetical protein
MEQETLGDGGGQGGDEGPATNQWVLPCVEFDGYWDR